MFLPVGLTDALPTCGLAHNCIEMRGCRAQPCVDHHLILTTVQQCLDHIGQRSYTSCTKDRSLTFMNARWSLRSSAEGDPKTEAIFSMRTTSQLFRPSSYSSYSPSSFFSSLSSCLLHLLMMAHVLPGFCCHLVALHPANMICFNSLCLGIVNVFASSEKIGLTQKNWSDSNFQNLYFLMRLKLSGFVSRLVGWAPTTHLPPIWLVTFLFFSSIFFTFF